MKDTEKTLNCALLTAREDVFDVFNHDLKEVLTIFQIKDGLLVSSELQANEVDIIVCDPSLAHVDIDALSRTCQMHHSNAPLLFINDHANKDFTLWAQAAKITQFLEYPVNKEDIISQIDLAFKVALQKRKGGLNEHEIGHVYNQLKSYYYDTDSILVYIKNSNLTFAAVMGELDKKARLGTCSFDQINNLGQKVG